MRYRREKQKRRWLERLRQGARAGLITFLVSFLGVVSGLFSMVGFTVDIQGFVEILLACVFVSIGVAYWKADLEHVPDIIIPDIDIDSNYSCSFCTLRELELANEMASVFYGRDSLSDELIEQWRLRNQSIFVAIRDPRGLLVGSFGVVPLVQSFLDQFIDGKVKENQISSNDVVSLGNARTAVGLYVSGVVVRDPRTMAGHQRACLMLWAIVQYLKVVYGTRKKRYLYALATTNEGERLIRNLKFEIVSPAQTRIDRHNLYRWPITSASLGSVIHATGDYSQMCDCEFRWDGRKSVRLI